jgi:hypothetical protein
MNLAPNGNHRSKVLDILMAPSISTARQSYRRSNHPTRNSLLFQSRCDDCSKLRYFLQGRQRLLIP